MRECNFEHIVFFDFDKTLVDFDTVNPFIRFVLKKHPEIRESDADMSLPHKERRLGLLAGLSRDELDGVARDFYLQEVRKHLIAPAMQALIDFRNRGYHICVVSGSYDLYLRFFVEEHGVDDLICTRVGFKNNICSGKFSGIDCLGTNKMVLIEKQYQISDFSQMDSWAYSDSQTDTPLFQACKKRIVVLPRNKKPDSWMNDYDILYYRIPLETILKRKIQWHWRKLRGID